jgi:4a-hydroxytetrahydrobiopterin dehydratase
MPQLLTPDEVAARLEAVGDWTLEGDAISRDVSLSDFAAAIVFVNDVAGVAESLDHHPDILVHGWNNVRLSLFTHSEGRITDSDREMAQTIDGLL